MTADSKIPKRGKKSNDEEDCRLEVGHLFQEEKCTDDEVMLGEHSEELDEGVPSGW